MTLGGSKPFICPGSKNERVKLRAGDSAAVTQLRRSSPEMSQTQNCQVRVDHHPKFTFSKYMFPLFSHPSFRVPPPIFFPKKKKSEIHLLEGWYCLTHQSWKLIQLHQGLQGRAAGGSHGPGFAPPKTGVTSPPKMMVILSHWVFPVYLQNWRFKACTSPALKRMAIFSIYPFVQFLVSG